ncbi:Serine/threonine protein kinase [Giardia duodenalis]|uniref:Serine/threonine protein kinase n=1 Tax=Giardia intestinalis TaxID=5741 RepID=V6TJ88_GIAIN|nr:Serine/threonine protein kinase [Giardia intestinalis]
MKAEDRISARKLVEILRLYQLKPKLTLSKSGCRSSGLNGCVGGSITDMTTSNVPNNWYGTGIP